jgi:hypothetical protein
MDSSRFDSISRLFAERRLSRRTAMQGAGALAAGAVATAGLSRAVHAQDATPDAGDATDGGKGVPFMFVQTFGAGELAAGDNGTLTLTADHLAGQTIYFSDRPERIVGMLPTATFLGAGAAAADMAANMATPEGGLGFTPADPPNAALVFASAEGDDDPGDVLIVELINPTYDPASGKATYEINVLADDQDVDMNLQSEPVAMADAIRSFDAASLFIDDCPDGTITCYGPSNIYAGEYSSGFCYDWGGACCNPCGSPDVSSWENRCDGDFPDVCRGNCSAVYGEFWACTNTD